MARLILNTEDTMTIETVLVDEEVIVEQQLVAVVPPVAVESHGEIIMQEAPRPDGWVAGEEATAAVLADLGALTLQGVTPIGGTREGMVVYKKARKWFGGARALGTQLDANRFPRGLQWLRLVPPGTYPADAHAMDLT